MTKHAVRKEPDGRPPYPKMRWEPGGSKKVLKHLRNEPRIKAGNGREDVKKKRNKGFMRLRYKGHVGNALAPDADERRSKLRKASGSCKQTLIRGSLNGETCMEQSMRQELAATRRSETSQYPEEKKSKRYPK